MNAVVSQVATPGPSQPLVAANDSSAISLLKIAVSNNASLDHIKELMAMHREWEADQARKAFNAALAKFKANHIKVVRSSMVDAGPLRGTAYAKLSDFVDAASPHLAAAGLSVSWRTTRDEKDWIEIACVVRHADGHLEETRLGGPPDTGGAKNLIQARASTVSYLEKYTLKMALGLAERDDDDDGNGGPDDEGGGQQPPANAKAPEPEHPPCPARVLERNHDTWVDALDKGTTTVDAIIATVSSRYTLSDEQKKTIRSLAKGAHA